VQTTILTSGPLAVFLILGALHGQAQTPPGAASQPAAEAPGATTQPAKAYPHAPLKCLSAFDFKDFLIGGFFYPPIRDDNYRDYKAHGFNVMLKAHYDQSYPHKGGSAGDKYFEAMRESLRTSAKVGLKEIVLTEIHNSTPWGNTMPPGTKYDDIRDSHYARLPELKYLHEQIGKEPALTGYLLNDNCGLHDFTLECAKWMMQNCPGLLRYQSCNPNPPAQGKHHDLMPISSCQNYALATQDQQPGDRDEESSKLVVMSNLEGERLNANEYDMAFWPLVGSWGKESPAQIRFQVYASIAYGAQGLFYFPYPNPGPALDEAKLCNDYVNRIIGPSVLGHRCIGVYHTGGGYGRGHWFGYGMPYGAMMPRDGQLVEFMSPFLMAGVLVDEKDFVKRDNTADFVMVVDKRTVNPDPRAGTKGHYFKNGPDLREVEIIFGPAVKKVQILGPKDSQVVELGKDPGPAENTTFIDVTRPREKPTRTVKLKLLPGEGRLLKINP